MAHLNTMAALKAEAAWRSIVEWRKRKATSEQHQNIKRAA